MKLLCIEDVIMDEGDKAFTKGNEYRAYESTYKENYDVIGCLRAKNDNGERHIIKQLDGDDKLRLDSFFYKHFKQTK
jgi:hypothetical protein